MKYLRWLLDFLARIALWVAVKIEFCVFKPLGGLCEKALAPSLGLLCRTTIMSLFYLSFLAVVLYGPTIHQKYIRKVVGSSVYYVSADPVATGTAFSVKAPSGKTYYLTNDHICAASENGKVQIVMEGGILKSWQNIVARSGTTDLCLIEAPVWEIGLNVARSAYLGDRVQAMGHPALMALTLSNIGEIIQSRSITLSGGSAKNPTAPMFSSAKCDTDNSKFTLVEDEYGNAVCYITIPNAFFTNVLVQQGSSGSPLVNFHGEVVGVISGVDHYGWGIAVPLHDVIDFLSDK